MKKTNITTAVTVLLLSACVNASQAKLSPEESAKLFAEQTTRINSMMPKLRQQQNGKDFLISEAGISKILDAIAKGAVDNSESQIHQFIGDKQLPLINDSIYKNANLMYFSDKRKIHSDYIKSLPDFTIESSIKSINSKVNMLTNGMILNAMENVPDDARVVLSNVMTFDAKWRKPFSKDFTHNKDFNAQCKSKSSVGKVPTMYKKLESHYLKTDGIIATTVPFVNDYNLLIAMSEDKKSSATDASEWLFAKEGNNINELMQSYPKPKKSEYGRPKVKLSLPKLDLYSAHDLIPSMKSLGIVEIFTDKANLSKVSDEPLKVSVFEQKIKLEADEEGAKAAAVTTGVMTKSAAIVSPEPIEFNVDHPFAFAIIKGSNPRQIVLVGEVNSLGICK